MPNKTLSLRNRPVLLLKKQSGQPFQAKKGVQNAFISCFSRFTRWDYLHIPPRRPRLFLRTHPLPLRTKPQRQE